MRRAFAVRRLKSTVIEMASILDAMNVPAFHFKSAPPTPYAAAENLSGSRIKSATEILAARRGAVPSPLDKNSINYIILKQELFNSSFIL